MRASHVLDEDQFGGGEGFVFGKEIGFESFELLRLFPAEDEERARQAVTDIVMRSGGFALCCFGSGRVLRIRLIRCDLGCGRHGETPLEKVDSEKKNASCGGPLSCVFIR